MSGTTIPASDTTALFWGPVSVSMLAMTIFFAAIGVAWWTKDATIAQMGATAPKVGP